MPHLSPLITIAIPTYNRAEILHASLSKLLPQVVDYKDDIEIVISDNASEDHTQEIINEFIEKYKGLIIKSNLQPSNTGYYGNFRKCRQLSNGKYFWLLSDNEVLSYDSLSHIMKMLYQYSDVGIVFLKKICGKSDFESNLLSFDQLFYDENYKLTLISACIMLNIKDQDEEIFKEFAGNSFLGFALLLSVRNHSNIALEISGEIYKSIPTIVSFNVFKSWTTDIFQCFDYIEKEQLFEKGSIDKMKESILVFVLKDHLKHYKLFNSYYGKYLGSFGENFILLNSYYGNINRFKDMVDIQKSSRICLFYHMYVNKIYKKLRWVVK